MNQNKTPIGIIIILALVFMIGIGGGFVGAIGSYPPVDENMVLYYHFNNQSAYGENDTLVYDFSGNGNNGTANNTQFIAGNRMFDDGDFYFNGINSSIIPSVISSINCSKSFSVGFWAKWTGTAQGHIISQTRSSSDRFDITTVSGVKIGCYNGSYQGVNSSGALNDGYWHYVIYSYDLGIPLLYVDNILQDGSVQPAAKTGTNVVRIGRGADNTESFTGNIDDLIVWNKSLSSSEMSDVYLSYINLNSSYTFVNGNYDADRTYNIINNNLVLDLNGSFINWTLTNSNYSGFYSSHVDNFTLRNGDVSYYTNSINSLAAFSFLNVSNLSLYNLNMTILKGNGLNGISFINSSNIRLFDSYINFSNCAGIDQVGTPKCMDVFALNSKFVNVSNNYLWMNGNNSYNIYYKNTLNSFANYNHVFTENYGSTSGRNIHFETGSWYNEGIGNIVYMNDTTGLSGNNGYSIYIEYNSSYNKIEDNNILSYGEGIVIEGGCQYNIINNNIMNTSSVGLLITDTFTNPTQQGNQHNNITNNLINSIGTSLKLNSNQTYNNYVANNIISGRGIGVLLGAFNNTLINNSGSSILNSILITNRADNNIFNENNVLYPSSYKYIFSTNASNLFYNSNFGFIGFFNQTGINNFYSLTSALLTNGTSLCNGSTGISSGNINITLQPNQYCYVLDNFNLTEGVTRQYSPLWFSSSTTTEKHIASNLSESVTALVISNIGHDCDELSKIIYTPKGQASITYTGSQARNYCSNHLVSMTLEIYPSDESNILEFEYQTSQLTSTILKLLIGFLALALVIGCLALFYNHITENQLNANEFIKSSVTLLVVLILIIALMSYIATLV